MVPAGPGAERRLADALADLAADSEERGRLGSANRARAEAQFRREAMVTAYRDLYEEVLAGAGDRALSPSA